MNDVFALRALGRSARLVLAPAPPSHRGLRGSQVRRDDPDSQGLAVGRPGKRGSRLRGVHSPGRSQPAGSRGLRACAGPREPGGVPHPDRFQCPEARPAERQAGRQSADQGRPAASVWRRSGSFIPTRAASGARSRSASSLIASSTASSSTSRTPGYAAARPAFDALVAATRFSPPNTGADLLAKPPIAGSSASTSLPSICLRAGPRCWPPARSRCCSPTAAARRLVG